MLETWLLIGILVAVLLTAIVFWHKISRMGVPEGLQARLDHLDQGLTQQLTSATTDLASRLEGAKGDLRQQMSDRLAEGFREIHVSLGQQLAAGRDEQATRLSQATGQLEAKFELLRSTTDSKLQDFGSRQAESLERVSQSLSHNLTESRSELTHSLASSLETIRSQVDQKLLSITEKVEQKLDQNIREGFAQFQKVQEHLHAAEEQLKNVGMLGHSINDLNNLLKLPHLRGGFGESSLERILADFLPNHMFELQASPSEDGRQRADAMIQFPDARLPIDAKFPREQILPIFESSDPQEIQKARGQLIRVIKEQARRIAAYIQPENGTTDMAFMYLPSETLYLEVIRSPAIADYLNQKRIFPVSPNTLLMSLNCVALVFKWYQVALSFEKTTEELRKAQKSFGHFQARFEAVGKSLTKVQEAYSTASGHLSRYRDRVTKLTGEEVPEDELPGAEESLRLLKQEEPSE